MGVNLYLLDRRRVRLNIGGTIEDVGMLRRSWKLTEFDQERRKEREKAAIDASGMPSPKAAMLADVEELPVGSRAVPIESWCSTTSVARRSSISRRARTRSNGPGCRAAR